MYLTPSNLMLVLLAGAATGLLGAVLGTGGGVFLVPLLVLGIGVPVHYAVATSIVTVIATSSAVAGTNVERGTANMRLGMTLELATALGAIVGGLAAGLLAPRAMEGLFGVVLIPTAAFMWRGRAEPAPGAATPSSAASVGQLGGQYVDEWLGRTVTYQVRRLWAGLSASFVAGGLSGLLGIGGGTFKVPALHLFCGVPIRAAAATSNFMIGVTAAASAFLYYGRGEVRPGLTSAVVLGVLLGSAAGPAVGRHIGGTTVRRLFAVLLAAVAVQMLVRALRSGGGA
jgi:uncharacterized membrane protein YfcA